MATHNLDFECIADAYVTEGAPTTNYGSANTLRLADSPNRIWTFLNFNLSGTEWIALKKINNIAVMLYSINGGKNLDYPGESGIVGIDSYVISGTFAEMSVTWNTRYTGAGAAMRSNYQGGIPETSWISVWLPNTKSAINQLQQNGTVRLYTLYTLTTGILQFHSRENTNKPYLRITYEDSPPLKPSDTLPNGSYLSASANISLSWLYRAAYGGIQKAYQAEWRLQGESEWNEITGTTADNFCVIPADTFPNGNIEWRVKTYNEFDEESPYSDILTFYAISSPAVPIINVIGLAMPIINWDSSEQQLWQAQIMQGENILYDTGEMPGAGIYSYKSTQYFYDGEYTARVRVRNAYELWSDWGVYDFEISTEKPDAPSIAVLANGKYGIPLIVNATTSKTLLYRREIGGDYIFLAELTQDEYTDNTPGSGVVYEYMARAIAEDDSFADSIPRTGIVMLHNSIISSGDTAYELKYRLERGRSREYTESAEKQMMQFVGREYPCAELSGFKTASLRLNYFIPAADLVTILTLAAAETIMYRNEAGIVMQGTIGDMTYSERFRGAWLGYDATFEIRRTDKG